MTSFLRFFLLALTPLLGVTATFGPALLYGLTATLLLAATAAQVHWVRDRVPEPWLTLTVAAPAVVLVTLVDLVTTLWLPGVRTAWGLYLNLLAFSPLLLVLPLERPRSEDLGSDLVPALRSGLLLTLLLALTALGREIFGHGTFSLVPGTAAWPLPGLADWPLSILETGAGAFFLAAAAVVGYRSLKPRLVPLAALADYLVVQEPAAGSQEAVTPPPPTLDPAEDWGETLTGAVADLPSLGAGDRKRILIIGSGNGELAYHLVMLCLDQSKNDKAFAFRVRGVDHFATRVEAAVKGVYREHQLEVLTPAQKEAYLVRGQGEDRHLWKVGTEPRLHIQFEVADFHQGQVFFPQPAHLIVLNQGIEYVTDDKKAQLLKIVCDQLVPGGALVVTGPFKRELLPEGMKRTGTTVFRKA